MELHLWYRFLSCSFCSISCAAEFKDAPTACLSAESFPAQPGGMSDGTAKSSRCCSYGLTDLMIPLFIILVMIIINIKASQKQVFSFQHRLPLPFYRLFFSQLDSAGWRGCWVLSSCHLTSLMCFWSFPSAVSVTSTVPHSQEYE